MKARPSNESGAVTLELNRRDEPLLDAATRTAVKSPFELNRILVPIDFSECSKKALQYALPLAKQHEAVLTLLHVMSPIGATSEYDGVDVVQLEAGLKEDGKKQLTKLALEEVRGQISTNTLVHVGTPSHEIIELARHWPADLIVISTHGRTGLPHALLGSVVEQVVQRAPCPVLVVREREREILAN